MIPDTTDDMSEMIKKVAKIIKPEINLTEIDRIPYYSHVD